MHRKIFIAGESGQLARALADLYSARGDVAVNAGRAKTDITEARAIRAAICDFKPEIVINAAGYTAVDQAEDHAKQAYLVNADGAANVAAGARAAGAFLIHVSTDYVFDGSKPAPYVETDSPNPVGIYGQSKLAGEKAVEANAGNYIILRTGWLYGETGTNFVTTMLRLAAERDEIRVVEDQWGSPTFVSDFAGGVANIAERVLSASDCSALCGIYHAAGQGRTSRYGFAQAIMLYLAAKRGQTCLVRPVATAQYPTRARRPANSSLDSSKLARIFDIRFPPWQASLEHCLDNVFVECRGA
jgi:dTDP-4-dehydrorhamnose reductase